MILATEIANPDVSLPECGCLAYLLATLSNLPAAGLLWMKRKQNFIWVIIETNGVMLR